MADGGGRLAVAAKAAAEAGPATVASAASRATGGATAATDSWARKAAAADKSGKLMAAMIKRAQQEQALFEVASASNAKAIKPGWRLQEGERVRLLRAVNNAKSSGDVKTAELVKPQSSERMMYCLQGEGWLDARDSRGWTPLMHCAENNNVGHVVSLVRAGADVGIASTEEYGIYPAGITAVALCELLQSKLGMDRTDVLAALRYVPPSLKTGTDEEKALEAIAATSREGKKLGEGGVLGKIKGLKKKAQQSLAVKEVIGFDTKEASDNSTVDEEANKPTMSLADAMRGAVMQKRLQQEAADQIVGFDFATRTAHVGGVGLLWQENEAEIARFFETKLGAGAVLTAVLRYREPTETSGPHNSWALVTFSELTILDGLMAGQDTATLPTGVDDGLGGPPVTFVVRRISPEKALDSKGSFGKIFAECRQRVADKRAGEEASSAILPAWWSHGGTKSSTSPGSSGSGGGKAAGATTEIAKANEHARRQAEEMHAKLLKAEEESRKAKEKASALEAQLEAEAGTPMANELKRATAQRALKQLAQEESEAATTTRGISKQADDAEAAVAALEKELEERRAALRRAAELEAAAVERAVIDDVASRAQDILAGGSGSRLVLRPPREATGASPITRKGRGRTRRKPGGGSSPRVLKVSPRQMMAESESDSDFEEGQPVAHHLVASYANERTVEGRRAQKHTKSALQSPSVANRSRVTTTTGPWERSGKGKAAPSEPASADSNASADGGTDGGDSGHVVAVEAVVAAPVTSGSSSRRRLKLTPAAAPPPPSPSAAAAAPLPPGLPQPPETRDDASVRRSTSRVSFAEGGGSGEAYTSARRTGSSASATSGRALGGAARRTPRERTASEVRHERTSSASSSRRRAARGTTSLASSSSAQPGEDGGDRAGTQQQSEDLGDGVSATLARLNAKKEQRLASGARGRRRPVKGLLSDSSDDD